VVGVVKGWRRVEGGEEAVKLGEECGEGEVERVVRGSDVEEDEFGEEEEAGADGCS